MNQNGPNQVLVEESNKKTLEIKFPSGKKKSRVHIPLMMRID